MAWAKHETQQAAGSLPDEILKFSWPEGEVWKYAIFSRNSMAPVTLTGTRYQDDQDFPEFWNEVGALLLEWEAQEAKVEATLATVKANV